MPNMKNTGDYEYTHIARIMVGKSEVVFFVYPATISRVSPFFEAALSYLWSTGEGNDAVDDPAKDPVKDPEKPVIRLPEDDPAIFEAFLPWLYTSNAAVPSSKHDEPEHFDPRALHRMIEFYIFTDKIQAIDCKNAIVARIYDELPLLSNILLDTCSITEQHLPEFDGMRIMIHDWYPGFATPGVFCSRFFEVAPVFALDVVRDLAERAR
ncbi:hypothetical protein ANO11243_064360 [Dothideomycetidae sp. 11243]|nr:hypothetical protein ANO11243_064360 [fungal sp. No.11243]